jgi:hypothetical protein
MFAWTAANSIRSFCRDLCELYRHVWDYVDEIVAPTSEGSFFDTLMAAIGPERRLAPRAWPALQANMLVEQPELVITVQSASNLAMVHPDPQAQSTKDSQKLAPRPRFATIIIRKPMQV